MLLCTRIRPDPLHILWHIAQGAMPGFIDDGDTVGWVRLDHRGIQYLDKLAIPKKQRPYVNNAKWEIRQNSAFEEVVRACADTTRETIQKRSGKTWIAEPLIRGLVKLNQLGYAHSYEAWLEGRLAGGVWGFQIGSYLSMNSMFHYVSNASKAAFGRSLIRLREMGFRMVDMNGVPDHLVNFGIEWIPQWRFEAEVAELIRTPKSISPDGKAVAAPWPILAGVPAARAVAGALRRVAGLVSRRAAVV